MMHCWSLFPFSQNSVASKHRNRSVVTLYNTVLLCGPLSSSTGEVQGKVRSTRAPWLFQPCVIIGETCCCGWRGYFFSSYWYRTTLGDLETERPELIIWRSLVILAYDRSLIHPLHFHWLTHTSVLLISKSVMQLTFCFHCSLYPEVLSFLWFEGRSFISALGLWCIM